MTDALATLAAVDVGGTLKTVIGVVLALSGLGILLMGAIALADKAVQKGATAMLLGAALVAGGLWLAGAF